MTKFNSIETARTLESAFAHRSLTHHAAPRSVTALPHGDKRVFMVFDLSVSRRLLLSKSFASFNYFEEGIRRLEDRGVPMDALKQFFDEGLLFREGPGHHAVKQGMIARLNQECEELENRFALIDGFISRRKAGITSPLDFSSMLVRLCSSITISRLLSVSLKTAMRAIQSRCNVFYYHFHPVRQKRMNTVLEALAKRVPARGTSGPGGTERTLAYSVVGMGIDPLVGTLCASLIEDDGPEPAGAPSRYCPTSFVSRVCRHDVDVAGHRFEAGDVCYVSIVPAAGTEPEHAVFPFGLGTHTCIGKRYTTTVLTMAAEIRRRHFAGGFKAAPVLTPDGAFLAFTHP